MFAAGEKKTGRRRAQDAAIVVDPSDEGNVISRQILPSRRAGRRKLCHRLWPLGFAPRRTLDIML